MITGVWLPPVQPAQLDGASGTPIERIRASNGFKADREMLVWMVEAHSDFDRLARALGEPFEDFSHESIAFLSKLAEAGEKIAILSLATGEAFVQELKCASDSALDVEKHVGATLFVKAGDAGFPLMQEARETWELLLDLVKTSATASFDSQHAAFVGKLLCSHASWPADKMKDPAFDAMETGDEVAQTLAGLPKHDDDLQKALKT